MRFYDLTNIASVSPIRPRFIVAVWGRFFIQSFLSFDPLYAFAVDNELWVSWDMTQIQIWLNVMA